MELPSKDGAQFSDRFLTLLREGYSLTQSFWEAEGTVRQLYFFQEPWIDANGDGFADRRDEQNGANVDTHEAGTDRLDADTWAPYIVWAEGPEEFTNQSGEIKAEVRDNKEVERVWAAVYSPSYVPPQNSQELVPEEVPTFELEPEGNNIFSSVYDGFNEEGEYQIAIYAQDNDKLKARLTVIKAPAEILGKTEDVPGSELERETHKSFLPIIQQ